MRALLTDTGPLFALVDIDDEHHQRAQRELKHIDRKGYDFVVAFPIFTEAYKLILRSIGINVAHRWLAETEGNAVLYNPEPGDYQNASQRVRRYADQALTLEDALLAVLSERLKLPVWTFDHHLEVLRAEVWRG
jgi:predicted nucleic acid-binding protein